MTWWELEPWPQGVRWYLENTGYQRAEDLMYWPTAPSQYQRQFKTLLKGSLPDFDDFDAPVAVRQLNPAFGTIPSGLFSSGDLLTESRLTDDPAGNQRLIVNLNHAVTKIEDLAAGKATRVVAYDLLVQKQRSFAGKVVVLAAGTIESAKIAKLSGLTDSDGLIGMGITDHPIFFTHFMIPQGAPNHSTDSQSKTLSRHKQASRNAHPYNMVIELGADLNQGRYVDPDLLQRHREVKGNAMLCEVVFLFDSDLLPANRLDQFGPSFVKPQITMQESPSANAFFGEDRRHQECGHRPARRHPAARARPESETRRAGGRGARGGDIAHGRRQHGRSRRKSQVQRLREPVRLRSVGVPHLACRQPDAYPGGAVVSAGGIHQDAGLSTRSPVNQRP